MSNPEVLLLEAQKHVDDLQQQAATVQAELEGLQDELDALLMERQWVITQARKGTITSEDMEYQLGALTLQELSLKREMTSIGEIARLHAFDDWEDAAREYLASLGDRLEELNTSPETEEERHELFEMKRKIVLALVEKVLIGKDKKLTIVFRLNVQSLLSQIDESGGQIKLAGTCSRR